MTINLLKQYLHIITITTEMAYRELMRDSFVFFSIIVQPVFVAFMGLWMLKDTGENYAIFVVVGTGMTGLWTSLLFMCGNAVTRDRWFGTLEILVGLPTPIMIVALGRNIAYIVQALLSMLISYLFAVLMLGYPLAIDQPLLFTLSLGWMIIAFVCFGLVIAPIFLLSPIVQQFQNGLELPVYTLAGFLFPIALLPTWTTPFSYILAPYWAAHVLHATAQGTADLWLIMVDWTILLGMSIAYLKLAQYLFTIALNRTRQSATLNLQ